MTVCVSEFPCKYSFQERALVAFKPRPILFIMNKICLNQCLNNQQETTTITVTKDDVRKHITSLKNKKAADIHGITSEHLKYASPQLVQILTLIQSNNSIRETSNIIQERDNHTCPQKWKASKTTQQLPPNNHYLNSW